MCRCILTFVGGEETADNSTFWVARNSVETWISRCRPSTHLKQNEIWLNSSERNPANHNKWGKRKSRPVHSRGNSPDPRQFYRRLGNFFIFNPQESMSSLELSRINEKKQTTQYGRNSKTRSNGKTMATTFLFTKENSDSLQSYGFPTTYRHDNQTLKQSWTTPPIPRYSQLPPFSRNNWGSWRERSDEWNQSAHYLARHAAVTPHKETSKLWVVFEHRQGACSLNDILHMGPIMLPTLNDIFLRFRIGNIILVSDVEKAFLQIRLHHADRDVTRVLWVQNPHKPLTKKWWKWWKMW